LSSEVSEITPSYKSSCF